MPEAAARRRVGVVAGDGEAPGAVGDVRPGELRRPVAARAPETVLLGADMDHVQRLALFEVVARQLHGSASCQSGAPQRPERRKSMKAATGAASRFRLRWTMCHCRRTGKPSTSS